MNKIILPDCWQLIRLTKAGSVRYKVFAYWVGDFTQTDRHSISSCVVTMTRDSSREFKFTTQSGSVYSGTTLNMFLPDNIRAKFEWWGISNLKAFNTKVTVVTKDELKELSTIIPVLTTPVTIP